MSLFDYDIARKIRSDMGDVPFASLLMAAYSRADSTDETVLRLVFPELCAEYDQRFNASGGRLPEDMA